MPSFLGAQRFTITPETPLVFVHLFKCAGTSVHDYLSSVFPPEAFFPGRHIPDYAKIVPGYLVYSGHSVLWQWNDVPMKPHFVTWLREPVARAVSAYYFLKSQTDSYVANSANRDWLERVRGMSFRDFVASEDPGARRALRDAMSRALSPTSAGAKRVWWRVAWSGRRALGRFSYIGIAERTEECLAHFARRFQLPPPARAFRSNTYAENARNAGNDVAAAEPVTPEIAAAIRRHSRADRLLYRKAVAVSARMT